MNIKQNNSKEIDVPRETSIRYNLIQTPRIKRNKTNDTDVSRETFRQLDPVAAGETKET